MFYIVNTLIQEDFQQFIANAIDRREKKVIEKKKLDIRALPEFVELFRNTKHFSCKTYLFNLFFITDEKGRTHVLIQENKKRIQVEEEKEPQDMDQREWRRRKIEMENEMQSLKERVENLEQMEIKYLKDEECLHDLYEAGIINKDGKQKHN